MPRDDALTPTADLPVQLACDDHAHTVTVDSVLCTAPPQSAAMVPAARGPVAGPDPECDEDARAAPTDRLLRMLAVATSVPELLAAVADLAAAAVDGADAVVICVVRDNAPATFAASRGMVTMLDATQYATGEGPCFEALCTRRTVQVDDVPAWRGADAWRGLAGRAGVRAVLAVPVTVTADAAATLSLYRYGGCGWSPRDLDGAHRYAARLTDLLTIADRLTADDGLHLITP